MKKQINFNHICKELSEDEITKLKRWYIYILSQALHPL